MSERYPLWCVDHGADFGEEQYEGPYDARHHAANRAIDPESRVRKCRRMLPSELSYDPGCDFSGVIGALDELARDGDLDPSAWANYPHEPTENPGPAVLANPGNRQRQPDKEGRRAHGQ